MKIADALKPLVIPIDKVIEHPRNARQGDVGAIVASLTEFGQVKPIVAQWREKAPFIVVAGNHMLKAAREMGATEIAVTVVKMSDLDATRYLVADNRTQELGTNDQDVLADILKDLAAQGALDGTGYDGDDVDELIADLAGPDRTTGDADTESVTEVWGVVIDLHTEKEQVDLLTELAARGLSVRALMS